MKLIVLLASFVALTTAYKCCPPKQFESTMGQFGGTCTRQGKSGIFTVYGPLHYDYSKEMVALEEYISAGEQQFKVKVIQDFNSNTQYVIMAGKCTKSDLPGSIDDTCIPDAAEYIGTNVYGLDALTADSYTYNAQQMGANVSVGVAVTANECLPFGLTIFADQPQAETISFIGFMNVTLGIKDPSVFDIPKICDHDDIIPFKAMGNIVSDRMKRMMLTFGAR
ncbi:ependymin-related protein 1-like [Saccoglossus kowalevskii]|uniref:Ependymin-related protein 1-like n=1 Tax=Saccoglossus kowalevskii TaxID=10224 RepID=A0ABM0GLS9_SACKO|nr:PREDICTED: ependymin-related protein 1-like [Saccoglossus kowalevskii]